MGWKFKREVRTGDINMVVTRTVLEALDVVEIIQGEGKKRTWKGIKDSSS